MTNHSRVGAGVAHSACGARATCRAESAAGRARTSAGTAMKTTSAGVRIVEQPEQRRAISRTKNTTALAVVSTHARECDRMSDENSAARHAIALTSGSACRRRARRGRPPAACRTSSASAASSWTSSSSAIATGSTIHARMSSAESFAPTPSSGLPCCPCRRWRGRPNISARCRPPALLVPRPALAPMPANDERASASVSL